jgi:hypothetical protein
MRSLGSAKGYMYAFFLSPINNVLSHDLERRTVELEEHRKCQMESLLRKTSKCLFKSK